MNDDLAKILGQMVQEIQTLGYFPDYRIHNLKTLADKIKITNTQDGPVASGVKPPKEKVSIEVKASGESDYLSPDDIEEMLRYVLADWMEDYRITNRTIEVKVEVING